MAGFDKRQGGFSKFESFIFKTVSNYVEYPEKAIFRQKQVRRRDERPAHSAVILILDRKLTCNSEQKLRQTRRLSQSIMEIYGQESQHSMAQFLPEGLSDFYLGIVSAESR